VKEASSLEIPIIAIVDSNTDPTPITYPIPANDDSIRTIQLIISAITDTILETMNRGTGEKPTAPEAEPAVSEDQVETAEAAPEAEGTIEEEAPESEPAETAGTPDTSSEEETASEESNSEESSETVDVAEEPVEQEEK